MNKTVELFVIDDHPVVINGLITLFDQQLDGIRVKDSATNLEEARMKLKDCFVDIILLDLILEDGSTPDFCNKIKQQYDHLKVIAFTGSNDPFLLQAVWANNVDAILTKICSKDQLIQTIKGVLRGERIIGKKVPSFFDQNNPVSDAPKLTQRESQVMYLLVNGFQSKDVADKLNITIDTVSKHRTHAYQKYGVNTLSQFNTLFKNHEIHF